ncbi:MAG TPA: alpha/beta hydrolase-fold protein [Streptosporangiaceae bacterium]|nr:alpha/beta hydrolase-fold protein [Streptosporangiaceae bacterium]
MGLTSGLLIGLAGFFAAGAFAGTLLMWRRLATPRPGHVLARAGLLLAAQVSVMLVIFLSVNRSFGFFASWSDLFGTNNTTGQIVAPRHQNGGQPAPIQSPGTGELAARTPPGLPRTGQGSLLTAPGGTAGSRYGRLQPVRIDGVRSGISAAAYVYLPPQYFWPAEAGRTLPVIVVISGHVTTAGDPYSAASLALTAAQEITARRARPAIYVMLSASAAGRRDLGCLDVPGGPQAATFFAQDLPSAIESSYPASRVAAGWAVLGDAAGGYCALSLAMAHSDRFGVAAAPLAAYSTPPGSTGTRPGAPGWWMSGGSQQLRDESDLSWRLRNMPPPPVSLCFVRSAAAGPGSTQRAGAARAFLALAKPPTHVAEITLAAGPWPLAPVLDRLAAELAPGGRP